MRIDEIRKESIHESLVENHTLHLGWKIECILIKIGSDLRMDQNMEAGVQNSWV
jgi:hypothetical protein